MRAILRFFITFAGVLAMSGCTNANLDLSSLGLVANNFSVSQAGVTTSIVKINQTTHVAPFSVVCPRDTTSLEISFDSGVTWESIGAINCSTGTGNLNYNLTGSTSLPNLNAAVISTLLHGKSPSGFTRNIPVVFVNPSWTVAAFILDNGAAFTSKSTVAVDITQTETAGSYTFAPSQMVSTSASDCTGQTPAPFTTHVNAAPLDATTGTARTYFQFKDEAGNTSNCLSASISVDQTLPVIQVVTSAMTSGNYSTTQVITVEVDFSKPVTVANGVPTLLLKTGVTQTGLATYASGSGTNKLTFNYTVAASDNMNAVDVASTGALSTNGASIQDAGGNVATLTLPVGSDAAALPAQKLLQLNYVPYLISITASTSSDYWSGDKVDFIATWSGDITVSSTPTLLFGPTAGDTQTYTYDANRSTSRVTVFSATNTKNYLGTGLVQAVNFAAGTIVAQGSGQAASNSLMKIAPAALAFTGLILHSTPSFAVSFYDNNEDQVFETDGSYALRVKITSAQTSNTIVTLRVLQAPTNLNGRITLPVPFQITIPAGALNATIVLPVVDNTTVDGTGELQLAIASTSQGRIVSPTTKKILMLDDDGNSDVVELALGAMHGCARYANGGVSCFGSGSLGQLANDVSAAADNTAVATNIVFTSGATKIAASANGSCAIVTGKLYCWGNNASGTTGVGAIGATTLVPTQIAVGDTATDIQMSDTLTCALFSSRSNGVYCWGADSNLGVLGPNFTTNSFSNGPVLTNTPILTGITKISVGAAHVCALDSGAKVWCWGRDGGGLGRDASFTYNNYRNPIQIAGIPSVTYADVVSGSNATCVRSTANKVYCWGTSGQNGTASAVTTGPATATLMGSNFTSLVRVAVSMNSLAGFICGVTSTPGAVCWGTPNGATNMSAFPGASPAATPFDILPVIASGTVRPFAVSGYGLSFFSCTGSPGGPRVLCSNNGAQPNLIDFPFVDRQRYQKFYPIANNFTDRTRNNVSSSLPFTSCVLRPATPNSSLECGGNSDGTYQPNGGLGTSDTFPSTITIFKNSVLKAATGYGAVCAILKDNTLWCYGRNFVSGLGDNPASPILLPEFILADAVDIAMGYDASCAITSKGALYCWGYNIKGAAGVGTLSPVYKPTLIFPSNVTKVSVGDRHTCAIRAGDLFCWGSNSNGQLGDTSNTDRTTPVPVFKFDQKVAIQVSAGTTHTCAIYQDAGSTTAVGEVRCWGNGTSYQLGRGSGNNVSLPLPLSGVLSNATVVEAWGSQTCALTADFQLSCWGAGTTQPTVQFPGTTFDKFWISANNNGQSPGFVAIKHTDGSAVAFGLSQADLQTIHQTGVNAYDFILGL